MFGVMVSRFREFNLLRVTAGGRAGGRAYHAAEIAVESIAHAIGARRTHIGVARARRLSRDGKHDAGHFH